MIEFKIRVNEEIRTIEYPDLSFDMPADRAFAEIVKVIYPFTMTTMFEVDAPYAFFKAIEYVVRNRIPGDIVECGVWRGGSMMQGNRVNGLCRDEAGEKLVVPGGDLATKA
jgi:hypothetical protein